jgi:hypothetical protein
MEEAGALIEGDRCERCGRTDVDEQWIWLEVHRAADDDCEFESVDLSFCSQAHAGHFLEEQEIDWSHVPGDDTSGVRVDRYFMGCGLLAIVLSVVGVVALVRWIA